MLVKEEEYSKLSFLCAMCSSVLWSLKSIIVDFVVVKVIRCRHNIREKKNNNWKGKMSDKRIKRRTYLFFLDLSILSMRSPASGRQRRPARRPRAGQYAQR